MADADPVDLVVSARLAQPDRVTCGACALVVVRMVDDPAYARSLVQAPVAFAGEQAAGVLHERFRHQVLATHRRTNGWRDSLGRWQLPWPRSLGTTPWGLAREMSNTAAEPGRRYRPRPIVGRRRASVHRRMAALASAGHALPLYVGNRWSPRHVVVVLPTRQPARRDLLVYDPADGRCYPIAAEAFATAPLDVAGWRVPWVVVVPT